MRSKESIILRLIREHEFIRFCIVGGIATAIHYGLYLLLIKGFSVQNSLGVNICYTIGYFVSWCCNLWMTARFTFKSEVTVLRGVGFAVSHAVNYGLHIAFLNLFLWMGISEAWAPIPVYCLVVPINFLMVRFVFRKIK